MSKQFVLQAERFPTIAAWVILSICVAWPMCSQMTLFQLHSQKSTSYMKDFFTPVSLVMRETNQAETLSTLITWMINLLSVCGKETWQQTDTHDRGTPTLIWPGPIPPLRVWRRGNDYKWIEHKDIPASIGLTWFNLGALWITLLCVNILRLEKLAPKYYDFHIHRIPPHWALGPISAFNLTFVLL